MKPLLHPAIKDIEKTSIFYALGDPARFQIVKNLYEAEGALTCMGAVEGIEDLPVSTRSHCFRILREAGVIHSDKKGRECFNTLRRAELDKKFPGLIDALMR